MRSEPRAGQNMAKAVLTDVQFWIPVVVLVLGVVLLVFIHNK